MPEIMNLYKWKSTPHFTVKRRKKMAFGEETAAACYLVSDSAKIQMQFLGSSSNAGLICATAKLS